MTRTFPSIIACLLFTGCFKGEEPVIILSAVLTDRNEVNLAVPEEFSSYAPASGGASVWVVGEVMNKGSEDLHNVEIVFRCTEGVDTRVLVATVESLPAGATVRYKTRPFRSQYRVKLLDEPPEIEY